MPRIRTVTALATAFVLLAAGAASAASPLGTNLGPARGGGTLKTYLGYYDAHKDSYVITDVSSKSQAASLHINYSAAIAGMKGAPRQFFIIGKAAPGQITVWGSEPGESDYNPLWEEVFVTFKPGVTPVLLTSDNQIDALAKAGKLTERDAHIVLNAPITRVGK